MKNETSNQDPLSELFDLCEEYMKQYPDEQSIFSMLGSVADIDESIEILKNRDGRKIIFTDDPDKIDFMSWEYE